MIVIQFIEHLLCPSNYTIAIYYLIYSPNDKEISIYITIVHFGVMCSLSMISVSTENQQLL